MKKIFVLFGMIICLIILGVTPVMASEDSNTSIGVGLGIPYGGIGGNFSYSVFDYADLSVGVGLSGTTIGYNGGVRVYFAPPEQRFRPRISAWYGVNTIAIDSYSLDTYTYNGLSVGAGAKIKFGGRAGAMDFDLMYIVTSDAEADGYTLDGRIKISAGYIFGF